MTERFKTPAALPTEHERELLTILIEECAEVQQRATKMLRFGRDEVEPGQTLTNRERLGHEIGDVLEMVQHVVGADLARPHDIADGQITKRRKLARFMQTEPTGASQR